MYTIFKNNYHIQYINNLLIDLTNIYIQIHFIYMGIYIFNIHYIYVGRCVYLLYLLQVTYASINIFFLTTIRAYNIYYFISEVTIAQFYRKFFILYLHLFAYINVGIEAI